jgi:glycosyltransferase involved in cell wall biosynthesis
MPDTSRTSIGIWSELGLGSRWTNEGVSRVFGFLIEGGVASESYTFNIIVQRGLAESVREDLRSLRAVEGVDWIVHEPSINDELAWLQNAALQALPATERAVAGMAFFANRNVHVSGWVVSFPHFAGSLHLTQPKAVLMPDALPYDFPLGWSGDESWGENGAWVNWRKTARRVLAGCDAVITFSRHVAVRHAMGLLDAPEEKIRVVPLAPPDLAELLPFVSKRRQTQESRDFSAEVLREYMAVRGLNYLRRFPFEQISFAVTTTQDRPTKNLGLPAEAIRRLVRERRRSIKLFTTAPIHYGVNWTLLPGLIEREQFHHDLVSIPDVPRDIHAALFHCATLTIHASFFEGIVGTLPFFESTSLGTPCIMARGPHVEELLEIEPDLAPLTFDPFDVEGLIELILMVESDREAVMTLQREAFGRLSRSGWDRVAHAYAEAAISGHSARAPAGADN